jgi:hypothetical protein
MTIQKSEINSEAFLKALAQQPQPLPEPLQRSLQEIGKALQNNQPDAAQKLYELIEQEPLLINAYQLAIEQVTVEQARRPAIEQGCGLGYIPPKSSISNFLNCSFNPMGCRHLINSSALAFQDRSVFFDNLFRHYVMPSQDWVTAAKKIPSQLTQYTFEGTALSSDRNEVLSALVEATLSEKNASGQFWDKADRIVVMTIGGASIGGAIGLIPGAIAGATVAALYGWYIGFAKTKSEPTS